MSATQVLTRDHGNPVILLPRDHGGGRAVVYRQTREQPLWISHGLPVGEPLVRVDVWHGRFAEQGAAVLMAGEYGVAFEPTDGPAQSLDRLTIASEPLFDSLTGDGWERRDSQAFRSAAMHGTLSATFEPADGATFGLVARYYNRFHHLRLTGNATSIRLERIANTPPDVTSSHLIAEAAIPCRGMVSWSFNGDVHGVSVDGRQVLAAREGYMGGVDIVGYFAEAPAQCTSIRFETTQSVPRIDIDRPAYTASIRPGNIDRLCLGGRENICWESGIQFGHIGGSEIKFTQGATLRRVEDGSVATRVDWAGPMPRMVENADDVRGFARGSAMFFADHIVIADDVLAWTQRSVGPDIDLLGHLLAGPARIAVGEERTFHDWALPADGSFAWLKPAGETYPVLMAFPLDLASGQRWLKVMVLLRHPIRPEGTSLFAWQCPSGLTASHDIRCSPTTSSQEYRHTIVIDWQQGDRKEVEESLLAGRHAWQSPMQVSATGGRPVSHRELRDHRADAVDFNGCFDRRTGCYVIEADSAQIDLNLNPGGHERRQPCFVFRNWPRSAEFECAFNERALQPEREFVSQLCSSGDLWIRMLSTIKFPARLQIRSLDEPG